MRASSISVATLAAFVFVLGKSPAAPITQRGPVMKQVARLVGGRWVGQLHGAEGDVPVQFVFKKTADGLGVEGFGAVGKGKNAMRMHSIVGWDPAAKKVYYADFHGSERAYFGHVSLVDGVLVFRFHSLVGAPGEWESHGVLKGSNSYTSTLMTVGKRQSKPSFHVELKRLPS